MVGGGRSPPPQASLGWRWSTPLLQVTDSGLLLTAGTLQVGLVGNDLVQVHPAGLRHIRQDKRINEWQTPGKKAIVKAALNERQVNVNHAV